MERADKVGQIGKSDVERNIGDRTVFVDQQPRRPTQPRAYQILMRRHPEHLREQPQKVEWAKPGGASNAVEIERLVRVLIEP